MGLPEIRIEFINKGASLLKRSSRGIVALILKDSTKKTFDTMIYKSIEEVDIKDFTPVNYDYISKTFMGTPSSVIVERVDVDAADYSLALQRLKNKKFNYLAIPGIVAADATNVATWIKGCRNVDKKTFKAVLPSTPGDNEGIINFATDNIKVGEKVYRTNEYCARIAGILAGLALTRSATYYNLSEVLSITESLDANGDIDAGKLILVNDGSIIKIGRGVNSLTTLSDVKGVAFKKIKIIEGMDLVRDDIRDTFQKEYAGKIINNYDNKILFLAAVNSYFKELEKEDVLDATMDNKAEIDYEAQYNYLKGLGVKVEELADQQIKEYNTGSAVFAKAHAKFVDAMEDLYFDIYMQEQ